MKRKFISIFLVLAFPLAVAQNLMDLVPTYATGGIYMVDPASNPNFAPFIKDWNDAGVYKAIVALANDNDAAEALPMLELFNGGVAAMLYPSGTFFVISKPSPAGLSLAKTMLKKPKPQKGWMVNTKVGDPTVVAYSNQHFVIASTVQFKRFINLERGQALPCRCDFAEWINVPQSKVAALDLPSDIESIVRATKGISVGISFNPGEILSESRIDLNPAQNPEYAELFLPTTSAWRLDRFPMGRMASSRVLDLPKFGRFVSKVSKSQISKSQISKSKISKSKISKSGKKGLAIDLSAFGSHLVIVDYSKFPDYAALKAKQPSIEEMLGQMDEETDLSSVESVDDEFDVYSSDSDTSELDDLDMDMQEIEDMQDMEDMDDMSDISMSDIDMSNTEAEDFKNDELSDVEFGADPSEMDMGMSQSDNMEMLKKVFQSLEGSFDYAIYLELKDPLTAEANLSGWVSNASSLLEVEFSVLSSAQVEEKTGLSGFKGYSIGSKEIYFKISEDLLTILTGENAVAGQSNPTYATDMNYQAIAVMEPANAVGLSYGYGLKPSFDQWNAYFDYSFGPYASLVGEGVKPLTDTLADFSYRYQNHFDLQHGYSVVEGSSLVSRSFSPVR